MEKQLDKQGLRKVFELIEQTYVAKVDGMGLSHEDYTRAEKLKLSTVMPLAEPNVIEKIFVNGELLPVRGKAVDIIVDGIGGSNVVDSGINGNIIVNGEEVEVYSLPTASTEVKGGVIVGDNISLMDGVISVTKTNVVDAIGFTPISRAEAMAMIGDVGKLGYKIVAELPEVSEAVANLIYMVKRGTGSGNNYIEYMLVEDEWEVIGSTTVDLSDYVKKDELIPLTDEEIEEIFKA